MQNQRLYSQAKIGSRLHPSRRSDSGIWRSIQHRWAAIYNRIRQAAVRIKAGGTDIAAIIECVAFGVIIFTMLFIMLYVVPAVWPQYGYLQRDQEERFQPHHYQPVLYPKESS